MSLTSKSILLRRSSIAEKACFICFFSRLLSCLVLSIIVLAPVASLSGGEIPGSDMPKVLRVGFLSNIFRNVDNRDAQVAMELWARELARGAGINKAKVTLLNSRKELTTMVRNESLDIVTLPALDYLKLRNSLPLVPAFVASNHVGQAREQFLVVSRKSSIRTLADLRGKTIDLLPEEQDEPTRIWLETLLFKREKCDLNSFFLKVNETPSASKAIMHVFFGKADAAVVSRGSFETTKAMNPQLGQQLLVIAESESIIGNVTCIPKSISMQLKRAMENAAAHLHESAMGRQMAALFHIDRAIPFRPMYLEGLTTLFDEHSKLKQKQPKRR